MTDITVATITDGIIGGSGVFDKLMEATNSHILREFESNRITATDYATVYLGAIQSALSTSLQFVLQEQQSEAQADLLKQQKLNLIDDLITNEKQRDNIVAKTNISDAELLNVPKQGAILTSQNNNLIAERNVINVQDDKILAEIATMFKQRTLLDKNILKAQSEIDLLNKKISTENGQTADINGGVIGAQIALYKKQKDGFDRDSEQKAAKIMADIYSVQRSTDEAAALPLGLTGAKITTAVDKMNANA